MCQRRFCHLLVSCLIIELFAQTTLCQPVLGQSINESSGVRDSSIPLDSSMQQATTRYYPDVMVATNNGQIQRCLAIDLHDVSLQKHPTDIDRETTRTFDGGWVRTILTNLAARGWSMAMTRDANYIIGGGYWNDAKNDGDVYIVKLDDNGNILFQTGLGGNHYDWISAVRLSDFLENCPAFCWLFLNFVATFENRLTAF